MCHRTSNPSAMQQFEEHYMFTSIIFNENIQMCFFRESFCFSLCMVMIPCRHLYNDASGPLLFGFLGPNAEGRFFGPVLYQISRLNPW